MEARPKIQVKLSKFDKALESASIIVLIVMFLFSIYAFITLPSTIPIHFNASGKVDDYGGKGTILILLLIVSVIYFGMSKLSQYPHIFNYATIITEANAAYQYQLATRLIRFLKLALVIIFTVIILMIYLTNYGISEGLGIWFLPITLCIVGIPILLTLIQSSKTK
jgi:uncharacterized membrane protein